MNLGGLPEWGVIYRMVHERLGYEEMYKRTNQEEKDEKKGFWGRLFKT